MAGWVVAVAMFINKKGCKRYWIKRWQLLF